MTPAEVFIWAKAHLERRQAELELIIISAWQTEALRRQKRLPRLERLLNQLKPKKLPSKAEIEKDMAEINRIFPEVIQ